MLGPLCPHGPAAGVTGCFSLLWGRLRCSQLPSERVCSAFARLPHTLQPVFVLSAALASPVGSNWVLRGLTSFFFPLDGPKHVLCLLPPRQPPLVLWWHAPSWSHSLPYPHPCADERSCKQQRSLAGENLQMSLKLELNINQLINMGRCQGCLHHEWAN